MSDEEIKHIMEVEHFKLIHLSLGSGAGELYQKLMEFPEGHPYGWVLDQIHTSESGVTLTYKETNGSDN